MKQNFLITKFFIEMKTFFQNLKFALIVAAFMLMGISAQALSGTTGPLTWSISGNTLTISGSGAMPDYTGGSAPWYGCIAQMTQLVIEEGVTTIGNFAFFWCDGLTGSLTIPNSVTTIGTSAFYDCSGFTGSLTIPNSVISIGNSAFEGCSGLTGSLTIPNSVTTIGVSAFYNSSGLTGSLTIPNSVTAIGASAFYGCNKLTSVTSLAVTPPPLGGTDVFYNVQNTIPVYVPCGSVSAYQNYQSSYNCTWNYFTNYYQCVIDITNLPTTTYLNIPLTLSGTVVPSNATNQTIIWSIANAGTTGATISNANVFNATAYGIATVLATITNGIAIGTDYIQAFFISVETTGIDDYETNSGITVYPNPTNGIITVVVVADNHPPLQNGASIQIYDISGRIVQTQFIASQRNANENDITIDISHLQQGMYYLKIGNETVKIIKN